MGLGLKECTWRDRCRFSPISLVGESCQTVQLWAHDHKPLDQLMVDEVRCQDHSHRESATPAEDLRDLVIRFQVCQVFDLSHFGQCPGIVSEQCLEAF